MEITFSLHAKKRMRERGISEAKVVSAISDPDQVAADKTFTARVVAKKIITISRRQYLLLVVYEIHSSVIRVVTVITTSKIAKYF